MWTPTTSSSRTWLSSKELKSVHDEIEFMPLEPTTGVGAEGADLRRLYDVPVELAVEIGRTRMTISQTLEPRPGPRARGARCAGARRCRSPAPRASRSTC